MANEPVFDTQPLPQVVVHGNDATYFVETSDPSQPPGDPDFNDVELLLEGEDNTDSSSNARTITGSPPIVTGKWGNALDLRSTTLSMTIPQSVLTGDITIEYWRYTTSNNNNEDTVFCSAFVSNHVTLALDHSGPAMRVARYAGGWAYYPTSYTATLNQWDFIRVKWAASGKLDVWANGTNVLDTTTGTRVGTTDTCYMSRKWDNTTNQFHGYIDDFRITSKLRAETTEIPTAAFETQIGGGNTNTYQWYEETDGAISGETTEMLQFTPDGDEDGNVYYITATNVNGSTESNHVSLTVTGIVPIILTQPQSITRSANTLATFTVTADASPGGDPLSYQWYEVTDGLLSGETAATLDFNATGTENGKQYYCRVTDGNGFTDSSNATLTVVAELLVTVDPSPVNVIEYRPSSFSVMATGGIAPLTYDWYGTTAGLLAADAGNTYNIASTPLSLDGDTVYCVVSETGIGSKTSATALATVVVANHPDPGGDPVLDGDITGPADPLIYAGQPGTISISLTEITGIAPYTVDWYNSDDGLYAADAGTSIEYTPVVADQGQLWWAVIEDSQGYYGQSGQATMAVVGAQLELSWSIEDATSDKTVVVYQSIAWSLADGSTQADYDDFTCPVRTHRAISTEDGHTYWIPFYDKSARCHRGPLVNDRYNRYYWTQDGQGLRYDTFQNLEYNSFTTGYDVGVPPPTKVPAVAAAQPADDNDLLVTRAYVYTYVTVYGEEGPPSPPTTADGVDGELWEISNMLTGPEDDKRRLLASKNIYRTVPAETGVSEYHYVGSVGINTPVYFDRAADETVSLNRIMECEFWYPPPEDLSGLTAHPNGFFVGYSGRDIYFSEPYRPHAWNPNYIVSTLGEIVGFGVFGTTVVVCTNSFPYTATGIHPQAMVLTQHDTAEPCLSRYGIVSMPFGVYYPGPNGLMLFGSRGLSNATKELMTKEEWQNRYQVTTFDAARYQSQYVALYNTTKGIMFAPDEPMAALVDLDLASGTAEPDQADSIFTDEHSGRTYLLSSCDMYEWNPVSGANLEFDWTSMEFDASDPVNFGASRIIWYSDWTPPSEEETWAWRVFNTARIAAAPLMPMNFNAINSVNVIPNLVYDLTPIDAYPDVDQVKVQEYLDNFEQIKQAFHWGPLIWVPEIGSNWPNTPYVVMELIANGQTVYEKEIGHTRMFRLPAGFKATRFRIRLRSNINIQSVKVAETGKELSGF